MATFSLFIFLVFGLIFANVHKASARSQGIVVL